MNYESLLLDTTTDNSGRWATVTQASPLRVKIDGDSSALGFTPDTLVAGLAVSDRVWVQVYKRRLVVLGKSGGVATVPTGSVTAFAGSSAPTGYLICDGTAVSRTTYAVLFALIGTTYGSGDGSTTFNLPNLKGRVVVGVGDSGATGHTNHTLAQSAGEEKHTMTTGELVGHTHAIFESNAVYHPLSVNNATAAGGTGFYQRSTASPGSSDLIATSTGSGTAFNLMQPYLVLNYIIKT